MARPSAQAIVKPAEAVGVFLEDGLVERLLADAADEPGVLPMLQEALALLGARKGRLLTRAPYDALGREGRSGMAVAMATKADATLAQLPPEEQKIARRIFLRLVQFGEGRPDTRRQLPVEELAPRGTTPPSSSAVLSRLVENRLLVPSKDEARGRRVDISHEMLIVGWPASQEWAKVRRAAELTRRWLVGEAEEWTRRGRGASGLLDEGQVSEAERWLSGPDAADLGVDEDIQALVDASAAAIRGEKEAKEARNRRELEQARDLAAERGPTREALPAGPHRRGGRGRCPVPRGDLCPLPEARGRAECRPGGGERDQGPREREGGDPQRRGGPRQRREGPHRGAGGPGAGAGLPGDPLPDR